MNYHEFQLTWAKTLNLSEQDLNSIRSQLPNPKYLDFISNSIDQYLTDFKIDSYNKIKDSSWPNCLTYEDLINLPQHIIDECRYQHNFDFLIYLEENIDSARWDNFVSGDYPVSELIRYKSTILDIQEHLTNKTVVDFACHAGIISLMSLHVGAKFSKLMNIRPEFLNLAKKILTFGGYQNQIETTVADIHDYKSNTELCQHADVALLYGIMYHVHDHCEILESICQSNIHKIIIDSAVPNTIIDLEDPLVVWKTEPSQNCWNGWFNGQEEVLVGLPNPAWFELYMNSKNYQMIYNNNYFSDGFLEFRPPTQKRSIMIFEKQDKK